MYSGGIISAPVSFADVKAALGVSVGDLGALCSSAEINKWSLHKPVRLNSNTSVTVGEMQDIDYGLNTSALIASSPDSALTLAKGGGLYGYEKPRGGEYSEPFRLVDFNGYNSLASSPHTSALTYPYTLRLPYFTLDYNPDAEIRISSFIGIGLDDLDTYTLVLIYRPSSSQSGAVSLTPSTDVEGGITTLGDLEGGGTAYWRQGTSLTNQTYDWCMAAYNGDEVDPVYLPLPDIVGTFTPTSYAPFTLRLPLSSYQAHTSSDDIMTGFRLNFTAEDCDYPFYIAIQAYAEDNGTFTQISNLQNDEYIYISGSGDYYAYCGLWEGVTDDWTDLNIPMDSVDLIYFFVRVIDTHDSQSSYFIPATTFDTPGEFKLTAPSTSQYRQLIIYE